MIERHEHTTYWELPEISANWLDPTKYCDVRECCEIDIDITFTTETTPGDYWTPPETTINIESVTNSLTGTNLNPIFTYEDWEELEERAWDSLY